MLATWVSTQLVFNSLVSGLTTGLLAMGMVLVYRSTRVINFAVGNIGLIGASLLPLLVLNFHFPYWLALIASLLCGTGFAMVAELIVIRRLFHSPRVIVLVATVGIAQLAQGVAASYPDIIARGRNYPPPSAKIWTDVFGLRVSATQLTILVLCPILALALALMLQRTTFGKAVEASADNRPLARLSGVNPKIISTFVWTVGGFLSTVSMILLSAAGSSFGGIDKLGPITLTRAMLAFVLASMRSFPRAMVFGALIGLGESLLRFNFLTEAGLADVIAFLFVLVVIFAQSRTSFEDGVFAFAPKAYQPPERVQEIRWVRALPRVVAFVALTVAVLLPIVVTRPSRQLVYATVICFAICALSLTVITGWAGQLSLSQMAFAGIGALLAAALSRGLEMDVWIFDFRLHPIPFALAIVMSAALVALLAVAIGLGALRVRGLRLAITTFMFSIAAEGFLYHRPVLNKGSSDSVTFPRGRILGIDLGSQRSYYFLCLAVLTLVFILVARLRRSGVGRSTIAVRDNPDTAASYTISAARSKLVAFALAGFIAALGGALLAGLLESIPYRERFFLVEDSLKLVGIVVIGGLGSLVGPVIGALWVIGLPAFFPGNNLVPLFTSSVGLLIIVMYFPGGFAQAGYGIRKVVLEWAARRLPDAATAPAPRPPAAMIGRTTARGRGSAQERPAPPPGQSVLRTEGVSVQFGGNRAVDNVSIHLDAGEIVGLIGTNGAGKSTFMNAVGGYVPSTGAVHLFGTNVSGRSVTERARLGLGRTFQAATLFPELTVRETIQVALEARGRTPFASTALGLPRAKRLERTRRAEADELIAFVGLGRYASTYIADLSTGTRRITELADLLALGASVLCLDEPTAGLAQRETEAFGPLLIAIRKELGASMIVIEHDMPLIMAMSNRVYCLEVGSVIAHGAPAEVQCDPRVIASYLGTDERAIARSNTTRA